MHISGKQKRVPYLSKYLFKDEFHINVSFFRSIDYIEIAYYFGTLYLKLDLFF